MTDRTNEDLLEMTDAEWLEYTLRHARDDIKDGLAAMEQWFSSSKKAVSNKYLVLVKVH